MNWGKSIIVAFLLFVVFIATLVTVCVRQDISLVTKDYYKEELVYQDQIDRIANTAGLAEKPAIELEGGDLLKVSYPDFNYIDKGALTLFCPSDAAMDKKFQLRSSADTSQYFSTEGLAKGMYRARMQWSMEGKEYYVEQVIYL